MSGLQLNKPHVDEIMTYLNEHGDSETCNHFNLKGETLSRYKRYARFHQTKEPKVLLLDMETCFMTARIWSIGKQYVQHTQIVDDWFFFSWSAKWLFSSEIMSDVLTPMEAIDKDDKRICQSIWTLMDQTDVIIGHNLLKFDLPKLSTRFLLNGFAPTSPFQTIDTLLAARKHFAFSSNRLDYLGRLIRNKGKIKTDFDLWVACSEGDEEALAKMLSYNKEDVALLEDVYIMLRPWIKSHCNMAVYKEATEPSCPNCGSANISENGYYTTSVNQYIAFRCNDCGAICRSRITNIKEKYKHGIMMPTAR